MTQVSNWKGENVVSGGTALSGYAGTLELDPFEKTENREGSLFLCRKEVFKQWKRRMAVANRSSMPFPILCFLDLTSI